MNAKVLFLNHCLSCGHRVPAVIQLSSCPRCLKALAPAVPRKPEARAWVLPVFSP
jgi:predicted amidophosphoribosyltransferase